MDSRLPAAASHQNLEAWRIHAAALVAEQIALWEREENLRERRDSLGREEAEVSAHLDTKLGQVTGLQEQLSQAREQLRQERDNLERQQKDLENAKRQLSSEREHFQRDQARLKQCWNRRLRTIRQKVKRWKKHRERAAGLLESQCAQLEKERQHAKVMAEQDFFWLQQAWQELEEERARFPADQEQWREQRRDLECQGGENDDETCGQDNRISDGPKLLAAPVTFESVAAQLQAGEIHLADFHRESEIRSDQLRQEREVLRQLRRDLDRRAAEWTLHESQSKAEQEQARAESRGREQQVRRREIALADLARRMQQRRHEEIAQVHELVRVNESMQQHWEKQLEEYSGRCQSLREAQQAHAELALALEQARLEFLDHADNPSAAAKRVERLRRRWQSLSARPLHEAERNWKALQAEQSKWSETLAHFRQQQLELLQREREMASREKDAEALRRRLDAQAEELEMALARWQEQEASYQQQLANLRGDLERLVNGENSTPQSGDESLAA